MYAIPVCMCAIAISFGDGLLLAELNMLNNKSAAENVYRHTSVISFNRTTRNANHTHTHSTPTTHDTKQKGKKNSQRKPGFSKIRRKKTNDTERILIKTTLTNNNAEYKNWIRKREGSGKRS
ncbi:hypothetical protein F4775DRAFT_320376 [Biscogniauxia sp. FL1348]|nr:hypothetical protein F4775DRAFT_320376 [Biscogniauxia sp. FL1348]